MEAEIGMGVPVSDRLSEAEIVALADAFSDVEASRHLLSRAGFPLADAPLAAPSFLVAGI